MPLWTMRTDYGPSGLGDNIAGISSFESVVATGATVKWPRGTWWLVDDSTGVMIWRCYAELSPREDEEARLLP